MRILLVVNHKPRDGQACEVIASRIKEAQLGTDVRLLEWRHPTFFELAYRFRPALVMTFPFTAATCCRPVLALKMFLGCRVACYRTEGGLLDHAEAALPGFIGYDRYPAGLVDLEIFWGEKMRQLVGKALLHQGRLTSTERCTVAGYVDYEKYFDGTKPAAAPAGSFEKRVLFATGFHAGDYSPEDIRGARDWYDPAAPDAQRQHEAALQAALKARAYRKLWIDNIQKSAALNPTVQHIIKPHPIEIIMCQRKGIAPYKPLEALPNVLYTTAPLFDLLPHAGLFCHYGSTALAESMLTGTPAAYMLSQDIYPERSYSDYVLLSDVAADITTLPTVIEIFAKVGLKHSLTELKKAALADVFNITAQQLEKKAGYAPSVDIAKMLLELSGRPAQLVDRSHPVAQSVEAEYAPRVAHQNIEAGLLV